MKRSNKIALFSVGLLLGASALSSCTASFCSVEDKAHMLYVFDYGVTAYYDAEYASSNPELGLTKLDGFNNIYYNVSFDNCSTLQTVHENAAKQNLVVPTLAYYQKFDEIVLERAIKETLLDVPGLTAEAVADYNAEQLTDMLAKFGYL